MKAKIRVWQIFKNCKYRFTHMSYFKETGDYPNISDYQSIYEGKGEFPDDITPEQCMEMLYRLFNENKKPDGYSGRSLGVSDVIEFSKENESHDYFYCDAFGFQKLNRNRFLLNSNEENAGGPLNENHEKEASGKEGGEQQDAKKKKLRIVLVRPQKEPAEMEIADSLEKFYRILDCDTCDFVYLSSGLLLITDDEGMLRENPVPNRYVGELGQWICGPFFLCREADEEGDLQSLTDEQVKYCLTRFSLSDC